ncbi:MAG TPA: peptide MFS transporter [Bryobacteraceae bacterium]
MNTATSPPAQKELFGHPRGLYVLAMTEMWERFSFYGTRAFLVLYLVAAVDKGGLGWSNEKQGTVYGLYAGSVYLFGLLGGWVADRFIGARLCVVFGALGIIAGNSLLAAGTANLVYPGLALIAIGTGFLKPNTTTMVGSLYAPKDIRRDKAFSIYYMGINTGALLSPLVCGPLAELVNWRIGFLVAAIGMVLGLIQYLLQQKLLGDVGTRITKKARVAIDAAKKPFTRPEWMRIAAIGIFFVFSAIFWAAFEQAGSSLNLFADQMTSKNLFGFPIPASILQSVQPIFVITLAPIIASLFVRMGKHEPSSPIKFSLGLLGASAGFWVVAYASSLTVFGKVSVNWLLLVYFLHTLGELCLSPVGLSLMTKLAPPRINGLMMGVFFASIAAGNYAAGFIGGNFEPNAASLVHLFGLVATVTLAAAIILVFLTPWIKKLMGDVK